MALNIQNALEVQAEIGLPEALRAKLQEMKFGKTVSFGWTPEAPTRLKMKPLEEAIASIKMRLRAAKDGKLTVTLADGKTVSVPFSMSDQEQVNAQLAHAENAKAIAAIVSEAMNKEGNKLRVALKRFNASNDTTEYLLSVNTADRRFQFTCTRKLSVAETANADAVNNARTIVKALIANKTIKDGDRDAIASILKASNLPVPQEYLPAETE